MSKNRFRLAAAAASVLALMVVSGPPALAAPDPTGGPVAANPALINPRATANLHITKYLGGTTGVENTGWPMTVGQEALEGVTFTVTKVKDVDLTTNAGWEAAVAYYSNVAGAAGNPDTTVAAKTCTTGADGQCSITDLPLGLYYVEETAAPTGVTKSAPFLVTLPMTNPDALNTWMYDVYVYPKNTQDTVTKTVEDKGTVTTEDGITYGDEGSHLIVYTITTSIGDGTAKLGQYVIGDKLDPALTRGEVTLAFSDGTPIPASNYTITAGNDITITFNETGLALLEANRGLDVVTTINATLNAENATGIVPNTATFIPNDSWVNQDNEPIESDEVISKYGDLVIAKEDAKTAEAVAGAEFTVYRDADGNGTCESTEMVAANQIGGVVITDATGEATFKGLQVSNFYNNAEQKDLLGYCLVETKAPANYNLLAEPLYFTIKDPGTATLASTAMTVKNEKKNLDNNLPLTGGEGIGALSIGGLLLIGGGVGFYAYSRRRAA